MRLWGYLKRFPNRGLQLDPTDFVIDDSQLKFKESSRSSLQRDYGYHPESELVPGRRDAPPLRPCLTLLGFVDANFAADLATRRSNSGFMTYLGRTPLSYSCKKQIGCEGSSYASELRAAARAARVLRDQRAMLRGLGVTLKGPSILLNDNSSVLWAMTNLGTTLRAKHLDIDYHVLRELTAWGIIQGEHIPSADNLSDWLTKAVSGAVFDQTVDSVMIERHVSVPSVQGMEVEPPGFYQDTGC